MLFEQMFVLDGGPHDCHGGALDRGGRARHELVRGRRSPGAGRLAGVPRSRVRVRGPVGPADGDRPTADVEVLAGALAAVEYALAARMHAACVGGAVAFPTAGGMLRARAWAPGPARRLARCGAFAADHPSVAAAWAGGVITADHVDPIARLAERFSAEELEAILRELTPHWGHWSPGMISRFVTAADRLLHPGPDPSSAEVEAHAARSLSFAVTSDSVILTGELPRVEGELVMAAIESVAETLRSTADHRPATARRADALVQLVNDAHAADLLPTRGGLPVALTVTLDRTATGDAIWQTSRGHLLTQAEVRWAGCDATITPVGIRSLDSPQDEASHTVARVEALAASMFGARVPWMWVARSARRRRPSDVPWPPGIGAASSPAVTSRRRRARPTTSRNGPRVGIRTSRTSPCCCAGRTTARSTCASGRSSRSRARRQGRSNRMPAHRPARRGRPTTERPS